MGTNLKTLGIIGSISGIGLVGGLVINTTACGNLDTLDPTSSRGEELVRGQTCDCDQEGEVISTEQGDGICMDGGIVENLVTWDALYHNPAYVYKNCPDPRQDAGTGGTGGTGGSAGTGGTDAGLPCDGLCGPGTICDEDTNQCVIEQDSGTGGSAGTAGTGGADAGVPCDGKCGPGTHCDTESNECLPNDCDGKCSTGTICDVMTNQCVPDGTGGTGGAGGSAGTAGSDAGVEPCNGKCGPGTVCNEQTNLCEYYPPDSGVGGSAGTAGSGGTDAGVVNDCYPGELCSLHGFSECDSCTYQDLEGVDHTVYCQLGVMMEQEVNWNTTCWNSASECSQLGTDNRIAIIIQAGENPPDGEALATYSTIAYPLDSKKIWYADHGPVNANQMVAVIKNADDDEASYVKDAVVTFTVGFAPTTDDSVMGWDLRCGLTGGCDASDKYTLCDGKKDQPIAVFQGGDFTVGSKYCSDDRLENWGLNVRCILP